ncbi:hypothetical protein FLT15_17735 [Paenibacillus thiaminolyticus]|uniref:DUF7210 family protein n=1 Tax=Paenibacillus thiaminolyticus TaxID=49283 RepID=UPI0011622DE6|nr:hypothetical protein [Paenibacillus thiaminolyticus]NGP59991.1 hypothetical protein [Paenibacillus thiaminolyticus]NGP60064.1 hypothetical protein [Paenibacillus thiaminolyticus]NGP60107.1 hypothetical protein [Paenibacillus thiaminolyticus]
MARPKKSQEEKQTTLDVQTEEEQTHDVPEQDSDERLLVTVTWSKNVKHNNERYRVGETAEVGQDEVEELLRKQAILPLEGTER